ncbi:MAG: hypothetical protein AAGN66_05580 [Acidobacteriota bacterium]
MYPRKFQDVEVIEEGGSRVIYEGGDALLKLHESLPLEPALIEWLLRRLSDSFRLGAEYGRASLQIDLRALLDLGGAEDLADLESRVMSVEDLVHAG